jgi:hypothetical protein
MPISWDSIEVLLSNTVPYIRKALCVPIKQQIPTVTLLGNTKRTSVLLKRILLPDYVHFMGSTVALLGNTKRTAVLLKQKTARVMVPDYAHFMGSLETILGDALDPLEGGVRLLAALVQVGLQHQRLQHFHDLQHGGRMLKQK